MKMVNGWLDTAVEIDYQNKSMSREGHAIKYICLHGTAGGTDARAIAAYFRDGSEDASAHFIIGTDGTIVQGISVDLAAWGNGVLTAGAKPWWSYNPNFDTISIEHCKAHDDNSDQLTPAQEASSFALVATLCDAYGIPKRAGDQDGGIIHHSDIDPVNRSRCPGPYPSDQLYSYLAGGNNVQHFSETSRDFATFKIQKVDDQHWQVNGHTLQFGLKNFWCSLSIDGQALPLPGLPLGDEKYVYTKDAHGNDCTVVYQACERAIMAYNSVGQYDTQPGLGQSYLAHINGGAGAESTPWYNPPGGGTAVEKIPQHVIDNINAVAAAAQKLKSDAGMPA